MWVRFPLIVIASLLLLFVVLLQAWRTTDKDIHHAGQIANHRLANAAQIEALNRYDYLTAIDLRNAALAGDAEQRARYLALAVDYMKQANEIFATLGKNIIHPAVRLAYDKAALARQRLGLQRDQYFQESSHRNTIRPSRGIGDLHEATRPAREEYQAAIESLRQAQDELAMDSVAAIAVSATQQSQRLLVLSWALSGLILVVTGAFWRRQVKQEVAAKEREIHQLVANRTVLVREVHHRIKNHLQGLMGLIQDQQRQKREPSGELDTLLGHVMSLVAVHGMQARSLSEQVDLVELISQQLALLKQSQAVRDIAISVKLGEAGFMIPAEHAVPLALVISELLLNACKHQKQSARREISLRQWQDQDGAHVEISNPVTQPVMLDLKNDRGVGTGLALVKSMLVDLGEIQAKTHEGRFVVEVLITPHPNDAGHQIDTAG